MNISAEAWGFLREWGLLLPVLTAATTAVLLILLRPLLQRYALARPNSRSSHVAPTPQGGGVAVVTVTIAGAIVASVIYNNFAAPPEFLIALSATAFIALVGAIDDIHAIPVLPRLVLQTAAVATVIATLPVDLRVVEWLPWWLERGLMLICGLWFINLVNFMDGLDWMTVAEVAPVTAGLAIIGMLGALPAHGILVSLALFGAILGFAPFNRPVARMFLGDVGSLPIGLLLGWLLVLLAGQGHLAAALLLPLYYVADATLTLVRRARNSEPIWQAHRTHFYQRATDRGFTVQTIVVRVFAVNVVLATLAIATVAVSSRVGNVIALILGAVIVATLLLSFLRGTR